jgi:niacin transporter
MKTRELALGALLAALSVVIPIAFGFLRVVIGPWTGTVTSHVPTMLGMFVSPAVALAAGLGSGVGFLIATGQAIVAARAFTHVVWGLTGALLYRRGMKPWWVLALLLPIHGLLEAAVVLPFGWSLSQSLTIVGIGTSLHHTIDSGITLLTLGIVLASTGKQEVPE